ncbi:MotE family protein [Brevibacillus dissolubilis]|uniref:MotE family protein n=1 Tax=Brevibacillus dissolubilis TaxID=1844116 RepID=UPI0011171A0E|nr:hypothetical protein [Brevibacillus dissolubilis]
MEEVQEEREYSKLEWFFYMILIPALFASLLAGVLLSLLGIDVIGKALDIGNSIPFVEKVLPDRSAENGADEAKNVQNELAKAQSDVIKSKQAASDLQEEVAKKESTIIAMQKQISELQKMMEEKRTGDEERQKQYADLAKMYGSMSAKNAAAIVSNLSNEEAVAVMSKMKLDQRALILEKMDPKKAADISILIKDTTVDKDDDIAALQQRVQILSKALSDTRSSSSTGTNNLVDTFGQMAPEDAGKIITTLTETNQQRAVSILAGLGNDKRAQILSAISKEKPEIAARLTSVLPR